MFKFLRSVFVSPKETEEEFRNRMAELQQDMDDLHQKPATEVAGSPMEATYYGLKLSEALKFGDEAEARLCLNKSVQASPCDGLLRMAASMGYTQLGEEAEALAQLGIALGVDPGNYAVHHAMARLLVKRGEQQAAEAVLETGWRHCRKAVLVGHPSRSEYFAILLENQAD